METLISTKFHSPLTRGRLTPRPHLEAYLQDGFRLVLVTAPAGFGKSTLGGADSFAAGRLLKENFRPDGLVKSLSAREIDVLSLMAQGLSNAVIASRLYLSTNTLKAHTQNIYGKLDVHSRVQAVNKARELELI